MNKILDGKKEFYRAILEGTVSFSDIDGVLFEFDTHNELVSVKDNFFSKTSLRGHGASKLLTRSFLSKGDILLKQDMSLDVDYPDCIIEIGLKVMEVR